MHPHLHVEGLSQSAGSQRDAPPLFNISHEWSGSSLNVIMGESGVGKSTLLKTLGGVMKPRSGTVLFEGRPLWTGKGFVQDSKLLRRIGFSFQNNALFSSMSCLENLAFPRSKRRPDESRAFQRSLAEEWLRKVGLETSTQLLPHELSGGMQKRLAIARTLMLEPDYIFFDDPTAGLDPITSRQISNLLLELLKDRPALTFIVTNDEDRARSWAPFVLDLEHGSLVSRKL